jgi:cytochrome c553
MPCKLPRIALAFLSQTVVATAAAAAAPAADAEHFEKRIRPLLLEHCVECHGDKKQKGSLRLDFKGGWEQGGDSGPAITPGKVDESLLWKAVSYTDRDLKMPPKKKLSDSELAELRTWIEAGAIDPRQTPPAPSGSSHTPKIDGSFWSFQPPKPHPAPAVTDTAWPANDIDRFILAKQEASGLRPAPAAEPRTLLRRLSFDLTGLPPSEELLKRADRLTSPAELKAVVDSLLASPAFAERWASHWLDMSRFAESSGGGRSLPFKDAWRFRDYILESLRDNVPVDRMIVEMIAGDLLPYEDASARRRQLTATGFLALGPTNYEEQDKGMLRMDIVDEQLDTIGKSFLGMTIGCARCHDHKFDPISTRDYYALAGIMRSTRTLKNYTDNVAHWIDTPLPLDGEKEILARNHEKQIEALKTRIAELKDQLRDAGGAELRSRKSSIKPSELPGFVVDDSDAMKVGEWKVSTNYGPFIGESYVHDLNEGKGEKTITFNARPKKSGRYEVRLAYIAGAARAERIPVTILHADGEELIYMKQATEAVKGLQFASLGTFRFEAEGQGYVLVSNAGAEGYVTADAVQFVPVEADALAATKPEANSTSAKINAQISSLSKELKELEKTGLSRPEAMTVAEDTAPEDARVHIRGNIRNLGAPVPRGFIQVLLKNEAARIPADQSGRLQLAEWITSRNNPLTARVLVNRVWHWLFGAGLVRTTDNFGSTGELPSHPELLDALAIRFMEDGWDLKRLIKEIVLSRTYRQSSDALSSDADPDNRLLTHMNRKRLDAECIRDAMLVTADTLEDRFGGPNVGGAGAVDSNDTKVQNLEYGYTFPDTRRSVYTAAFRNVRHPLFEVFDFADINQPLLQRTTSTVATQALFMMNHPFVITQARAAADKILADAGNDEQRLSTVYLRSLGRAPGRDEFALSLDYLDASRSGNATPEDIRDSWARLIQTLWATPEFRFLR